MHYIRHTKNMYYLEIYTKHHMEVYTNTTTQEQEYKKMRTRECVKARGHESKITRKQKQESELIFFDALPPPSPPSKPLQWAQGASSQILQPCALYNVADPL